MMVMWCQLLGKDGFIGCGISFQWREPSINVPTLTVCRGEECIVSAFSLFLFVLTCVELEINRTQFEKNFLFFAYSSGLATPKGLLFTQRWISLTMGKSISYAITPKPRSIQGEREISP